MLWHAVPLLCTPWLPAPPSRRRHPVLPDPFAAADERCLKYAPEELLEWVRLALGCEQAAHESVAALAHIAQFGAE